MQDCFWSLFVIKQLHAMMVCHRIAWITHSLLLPCLTQRLLCFLLAACACVAQGVCMGGPQLQEVPEALKQAPRDACRAVVTRNLLQMQGTMQALVFATTCGLE